jgi:hypothetical protein
MPKNWQASMTYLERKYPNEYALRAVTRVDTTTPEISAPVRIIGLPDEELKKLVGSEYTQLENGNVERVVAGVRILYARLT